MADGSFIRRGSAFFAACLLCFAAAAVVPAEKAEGKSYLVAERDNTEQEQSKTSENTDNADSLPSLGSGETGILIDSVSGRVLFGVEENKRMFPASTTKIMVALLAIEAIEREEIKSDTQIEVTAEMLEGLDPDGSNMALKEGEILSLKSLLYGLMIPSGNDAACAIAVALSGSREAFVDKMNARAAELGATETHFENPSGLHNENHYTTAADMAKITREAMKLEKFRDIVDIAHIKIPPTNKTAEERYYINTNGLVSSMRYVDYYYTDAIGVKTGYTSNAGNCLVSAAVREGAELIGVVFGGRTVADSHKDSIKMLEWGFSKYTSLRPLAKDDMPCEVKVKRAKGSDMLTLAVQTAVSVTVPRGTDISELELKYNIPEAVYAPVQPGDNIGSVSVLLRGEELGTGQLIACRAVERSAFWPAMALGEWLWGITAVRIFVYLCIGAAALFVLIFIIGIYRNIKMANRRARRRYRR